MWILNGMIILAIALLPNAQAQNVCTAQATAACAPYTCVQTDTIFSCLCGNGQLAQSAAGCGGVTQAPIVNQCANVICPAGATCVPTNQNPPQYVCICANNVIANPDCTTVSGNQCLTGNVVCGNGGTCVYNQLTGQGVCLCPPNTYGPNCLNSCVATCNYNWCYNGGRCANAYGQAYCSCPLNYRGRRCELRYNQYNYVYLYHSPYYYYGKK